MAAANIVELVMQDMILKLKNAKGVSSQGILEVNTIDEFLKRADKMYSPVVGVWYAGITPQANPNGTGLASTINVSVFMIGARRKFSSVVSDKGSAIRALDSLRAAVRMTTSPTGHPWKFIAEAPKEIGPEVIAYVQHWSTDVILM